VLTFFQALINARKPMIAAVDGSAGHPEAMTDGAEMRFAAEVSGQLAAEEQSPSVNEQVKRTQRQEQCCWISDATNKPREQELMKKLPFTGDELFPCPSPSVKNAGAEALQSRLIYAFESAIFQGMHPCDALAVILDWASSELNRVDVKPKQRPR
jgi:hypothetical protein